jgi:hypothetical protein
VERDHNGFSPSASFFDHHIRDALGKLAFLFRGAAFEHGDLD